MGANLVRRLMRDGHRCVGYARTESTVQQLAGEGMVGAASLADLVAKLDRPRVVWLMVPAAAVQPTLDQLVGLLDPDDVVIDGGNSYYRDDIARAEQLATHQIHKVSMVGRTESRARADGVTVRIVEYDIGKAMVRRVGYTGRANLVVDAGRRALLGATCVDSDVADLQHSATIAVNAEVPLDRLWHAVPPFPTVSEFWLRLLEQYGL
ncbi:hypothetical protein Psi02_70590 [Planotetraspora silvatica]|uniref:6-phosphogluconate dehydrogenase NADP-binding domain-containing protein n=1 Tax=Planotetraspora silvatica TaxID=234614 RepID=A0A8J3UTX0_9ACTN|nr:NAD(P)-binding domain-containing protein [Planotetraspora silvatica]GII50635.1 hypothetical protein Psi02_70590 [Planotetraspora silvatica]